MKLPDNALCFKNKVSPEMFIYIPRPRALYYSPDGMQFVELEILGFGGSEQNFHASFENPHHQYKGDIDREQGTVLWGAKIFKLTETAKEIDLILLSTLSVRQAIYLFKLADGTHFYVSKHKYKDTKSYKSYKLFMGNTNGMDEIPIQRFERYRDGGTTYIYTHKGKLYSPPSHDKKKKPTWDGEPMEELDPKNFNIIEDGSTVKITSK